MQQNDTLNLLISCESQAQLEAYLGIFRDAGHTTRAHRVSSLRNLGELVRDPQWDGLVATDRHPELSVAEALNLLAERGSDLPCVVRLAEVRADLVLDCLKRGAREVMAVDENARLVHATLRELRALREHRELLALRVQYAETARRAELLLAASQDAIAYVVDGMHVHANELYAGMFGYASVEELAGVGIVDLIAASKQKAFKDALREYRSHPEEQTAIEFTGLRADGEEFGGQLVLSTASYESEPCMQVLVRATAPAVTGAAAASPAPQPAPASASAGGLMALRAALAAESGPGQLMLIGIDGYSQHCRKLGASAAARLVEELASFVAEANAWKEPVLHVADAVFARILPKMDAEGAADSARLAVESVAGHIHTAGSQSLTCSISVAICPLDSAKGVDALIDRAWQGLLDAIDRGANLRAADPARVEVLREAQAAPATVAGASGENLGEAVRQQQFRLLFQPIVSLRGDTSEYYQVQVIHAASGKDAGDWLAATAHAEASLDLDKWTVIESLKQLATHRRTHPGTRLILPIGAGAVLEAEFANWFGLALRAAELPADCVVVQVSHRAVSSSLRQAKQLAERLQALGCALAVCDVHSANNPVADLAHLKPQFARIDSVLAQSLKDAEATNTLLKPLIESLHQEQIASIMPNVDSASVLAVLWQLGVNYIQGDYLQKPTPSMSYDFTDMA